MNERKVYKHVFTATVLTEEEGYESSGIGDVSYDIDRGPALGVWEHTSVSVVMDREEVEAESRMLGNDGGFFTELWDEEEE